MKVLDRVKNVLNNKKADKSNDLTAENEKLIELYKELEKTGFSISKHRKCLGSFSDSGDSFNPYYDSGEGFFSYNVMTTLFQNGILVIDSHREKEYPEQNIQKENSSYIIVSKDEKGEFVISRPTVKIEQKPNIDMRCTDTVVTVNGTTINMDSPIDIKNITPEFKHCYASVEKFNKTVKLYEETQRFFSEVINGVQNGTIKAKIKAKCVCVDARQATKEEVGTKFTVWSHGKVEKETTVREDTVFLTTLDRNGNPVIDEKGNTNTYDMSLAKFKKKYKKHSNGHYVQDPTPMATIKLPDSMIPEQGKELLPPCWGGHEGTLMRGGLLMLPFNPELSQEEQIYA